MVKSSHKNSCRIGGYTDHTRTPPASRRILSELSKIINSDNITIDLFGISSRALADLLKLIEKQKISGKIAKQVFSDILSTGENPQKIVQDKGLTLMQDKAIIGEAIAAVLNDNAEILRR